MREEDNEQKIEKREAILQATLELVAEHGLQHTPMSLISKHSRASAGIIYHYFASKDDLLRSLHYRIKEEMSRVWLAADDPQQPLARRFQSFWQVIYRYSLTHPREMAFLEQYESLPTAKQQEGWVRSEAKTLYSLIDDPHTQELVKELPLDMHALYGLIKDLRTQDLVKDLPLEVIGEFTIGMALRLARQVASGQIQLDQAKLDEIARACWDAIAR